MTGTWWILAVWSHLIPEINKKDLQPNTYFKRHKINKNIFQKMRINRYDLASFYFKNNSPMKNIWHVFGIQFWTFDDGVLSPSFVLMFLIFRSFGSVSPFFDGTKASTLFVMLIQNRPEEIVLENVLKTVLNPSALKGPNWKFGKQHLSWPLYLQWFYKLFRYWYKIDFWQSNLSNKLK